MSRSDGIVRIHGKAYSTVARRVALFRKRYPATSGWSIITTVEKYDDDAVTMCCCISNPEGIVIASGWARDGRSDSNRHKTSWVEIAETSAVGRALAFLDEEFMGDDLQIASADEVINARQAQSGAQPSEMQAQGQPKETMFDSYLARIEDADNAEQLKSLGKGINALPLTPTAKQALHKVCGPRFQELKQAEQMAKVMEGE
jgi:hypothetical protein